MTFPWQTEVTLVSDQSHTFATAMKNLFFQARARCDSGRHRRAVVFLRSLLPTPHHRRDDAAISDLDRSTRIRFLRSNHQRHDAGWNRVGDWNSRRRGNRCGRKHHSTSGGWASHRCGLPATEQSEKFPVLSWLGPPRRSPSSLPALFLTGMIKYLFAPLSLAATLTIGASYLLALTVIPSFCATFIRDKIVSQVRSDETEPHKVDDAKGLYTRLLRGFLKTPALTALVIVAGAAASFSLWPHVGSELFPEVDSGTFEIRIKTVPGTKLTNTEALVAQIEETVKDVIPEDEIEALIANIGLPVGKGAGFSTVLSSNSGPDTAYLIVNLKQEGRTTGSKVYIERLRERLAQEFPMERFLFVSGGIVNMALNEGVPTPISVQVSAGSLQACRDNAERVVEAIRPIAGTADVQIAQSLDYPQFDVQVDRTRAKYLGVDQKEIAETVLTALGSSVGYSPTIWIDPNTGVDFFMGVQYEDNVLESLDDLRNIPISLSTKDGPITVPLSNLAKVNRVNIPGEIAHYNISRVNDIHVNVSGRDLGSVAKDIEATVAKMEFADGVAVKLRGPVEKMRSGLGMLGIGAGVAVLLVYLVLMAQFRSFVDPLIIMLAVPLGLGGVLIALYVTNTTINIQSLMGTLMMVGVVVNNAILLVEFANRRLADGVSAREAALSAASIRLRPILMTSLTLIASMIPLSFQLSPGNEAMLPLARALLGGMVASTVLTLVLVPCVYTLVHRGGGRADQSAIE